MSDFAIEVKNLTKQYGPLTAVGGLDLAVRRGEIFALLGPNGAGKSTTVEILEGFRKRTSGDVAVLGTDPEAGGREWRERLGIMLQSTSEHAFLSPREALTHGARLYPQPRAVDATLAAVGLLDKADAKPRTLSGGQRRRLEVGLAIIGNPELVFLDEPTTGFDPEARRQFWSMVEGLRADGTTVLLTTHYLDEAEYLADRIAIIAKGQLVALDTPAGLRARNSDARVSWRENGVVHQQTSATPSALLREILARTEGEVDALNITHPTLEDIYLDLISAASAHGAEQDASAA